jgi:hypothetical protein
LNSSSAHSTFNSLPCVADSGATGHFFETTKQHHYLPTTIPYKNVQPTTNGIRVLLPDSSTLQSTHTAELDLPLLPLAARKTNLFPHLASGSLLSIGQLCDHGCTAHFTKNKLYIFYERKLIMQGTRQPNKLWTMDPVPSSPTHIANAAIDTPTIAERIRFYHASLFSPTLDTLCKAIDSNYLTTFPGFTSTQVRKHPPRSLATYKGHLNAQKMNVRSTKKSYKSPNFLFNLTTSSPSATPHLIPMTDEDLPLSPSPPILSPPISLAPPTTPPPVLSPSTLPSTPVIQATSSPLSQSHPETSPNENQRTHFIYPACITMTGNISTDQTGPFPTTSISGNRYVFVIYDYDSNLIYGIPIPSRTKTQLTKATSNIINLLKSRGLSPKLQRLDNEISKELEQLLHKEGIDYQLTPTGLHRRNAAEKAIQTFKNHLIAGLSTTNPSFPINLWDKLIPQANITLNLLRPSRINPRLSAYAQVFGAFDYNKTPLAPPGIAILCHIRPEKRQSWAPHALSGYYIGPAMNHYRNHRVWITNSQAERIADKVEWLPHNNIKMPIPSRESLILSAANDLTQAIKSQDQNPLLPPVTTNTRIILQQLQSIFNTKFKPSQSSSQVAPIPPPSSQHHRRRSAITWNPQLIQPASLPPASLNTPLSSSLRSTSSPPLSPVQLPRVLTPPQTPAVPLPRVQAHQPRNTIPSPVSPPLRRSPRLQALNAVLNTKTGKLEQYKQLVQGSDSKLWINGMSKELARLTQGRKQQDVPFHDVMEWKHPRELPPGCTPTYLRVCANFRPQKSDPYRVRCTMGGNLITPKGPTHTPTADLSLFKLFVNSVISTKNAKFMDLDLKDFYICHEKEEPDYMLVPFKLFPEDIIEQYDIKSKVDHRGLVLAVANKAMYGHPEAGRISYDQLVLHLQKAGYYPAKHTPGLFHHSTKDIKFILVVDDFGIKYTNIDDAKHLIAHLKTKYTVTEDWSGTLFCGITLDWDYDK